LTQKPNLKLAKVSDMNDRHYFLIKGIVRLIGLFDNESKSADVLTIEYKEDNGSQAIRITDNTGFFVLNNEDFTNANWARLLTNLERIKAKENVNWQ
jgi:hypothetical protein